MAELPILYSFRRCPYAMRARLALAVSETNCILREVKLADKPAELIAASPKATVPVLVLETGEVLEESLDPGEVVTVEFNAERTGSFGFYCTEFCSALHLEMQGWMVIA